MISDPEPPPLPEPGKPDPLGPRHLDRLQMAVKGIVKERKAKEHAKRMKTGGVEEPNRYCRICTATWISKVILAGDGLQPAICEQCQAELDTGRIAIIVPQTRKHCFVYSATLAGHGPIIEVSDAVFEELEKRAKEQSTEPGDTDNPAAN